MRKCIYRYLIHVIPLGVSFLRIYTSSTNNLYKQLVQSTLYILHCKVISRSFETFLFSHSHPRVRERKKESVKEQDYQVQVRVLECRQLAGTQLDPVCTVTVGNQKKHTAVKEQTNCPYWDEVHDQCAPW